MTKQELQKIVYLSVKKVFKEEVKPLIEFTIKKEFNKILSEAETTPKPQRTIMTEETMPAGTSLVGLMNEETEADPARAEVSKKIFNDKNPFASVLNQTANDVTNRAGIYSNPNKYAAAGDQVKMKLNNDGLATTAPIDAQMPTQTYNRSEMAAKMGYGDMPKIGIDNKVKNIIAKDPTPSAPLNEVELPATNADGKPINYANVPQDIIKNMMKNYSGLLKKVESKVMRP